MTKKAIDILMSIGFDIGKDIFDLVDLDSDGQLVLRKKLKRLAFLLTFEKPLKCVVGVKKASSRASWQGFFQSCRYELFGQRLGVTADEACPSEKGCFRGRCPDMMKIPVCGRFSMLICASGQASLPSSRCRSERMKS